MMDDKQCAMRKKHINRKISTRKQHKDKTKDERLLKVNTNIEHNRVFKAVWTENLQYICMRLNVFSHTNSLIKFGI